MCAQKKNTRTRTRTNARTNGAPRGSCSASHSQTVLPHRLLTDQNHFPRMEYHDPQHDVHHKQRSDQERVQPHLNRRRTTSAATTRQRVRRSRRGRVSGHHKRAHLAVVRLRVMGAGWVNYVYHVVPSGTQLSVVTTHQRDTQLHGYVRYK